MKYCDSTMIWGPTVSPNVIINILFYTWKIRAPDIFSLAMLFAWQFYPVVHFLSTAVFCLVPTMALILDESYVHVIWNTFRCMRGKTFFKSKLLAAIVIRIWFHALMRKECARKYFSTQAAFKVTTVSLYESSSSTWLRMEHSVQDRTGYCVAYAPPPTPVKWMVNSVFMKGEELAGKCRLVFIHRWWF